ncbi:RelA/SpoT family (p)ppGpp synthetase [Nocardia tenerifensis]|uniref:RelA/SpoT family (P)ppGpp synthetase n=2 Tax=Nocardia tenerifensis TaxID=228006 RepID=A0A318JR34_9NOCA|nr:RelA/SpoT family (p)ppGpp synthetase [Nocardia tenerifensis]
MAIHAINGMAGIGKTTLAVHAAHKLAPRFPDGQYFVQLHAHTPGESAAGPAEILAWLLIAIGIDPGHLPATVTERRDLWRHLLAGRKMLLVLDDAVDREQIEPLLPSGSGCLTLITSRRRLTLPDTNPLELELLDRPAAVDLVFTVTGRDSTDLTERHAAGRIADVCGCLPLAIVLVAGQLAHHKTWTAADIGDYAGEVEAAANLLAALDDDAPAVRAAFDLSYRALPPQRQQVFRRLGLHPGRELDAYAAAALIEVDITTARRELLALYDDHLLNETRRGRYRLHDLLHSYANSLTTTDSEADTDAAVQRLLDYYQHAAAQADRWPASVTHIGTNHTAPARARDAAVPEFGDQLQALTWLRTERDNLLACLDHTVSHDLAQMVALTKSVARLLEFDGQWPRAAALHQRAAETTSHLGDRLGEADALDALGRVHRFTGHYEQAIDLHQQALTIYRDLGHQIGEADSLQNLGRMRFLTDEYERAAELFQQAVAIYNALGESLGKADTLVVLGRVRETTSDYEKAADLHQQALTIYRDLGYLLGEADALCALGRIRETTGDYEQAADLHQQALTIYRDLGYLLGEADALCALGRVCRLSEDYEQAAGLYVQALTHYRALGHRHGEADALDALGDLLRLTRDYGQATAVHQQALTLYRTLGSRLGEASALKNLGHVCETTEDHGKAAQLYTQALTLYRAVGHPHGEADALRRLTQHDGEAAALQQQASMWLRASASVAVLISAFQRVRAQGGRLINGWRAVADVKPALAPLASVHRELYPKADLQLLERAFDVADEKHADQRRKSGDPYITHPLAVANILAELGMDTTTLVAALLHDTVSYTDYSLEQLTGDFGQEVAHLVDGVTKLDKANLGAAAEAETIRKLIIAMARDPRVLVIKVADRLHNMRTMRFLPAEQQAKKAKETLEVIAPLAHRLGMATVKWELEDLAFGILHPKKYDEIVRLVADRAPARAEYLNRVRAGIIATLDASRITAVVEGRPQHYWSIYQKMIVKGRDFDDIHDLVGVRILCDYIRDCYAAVGVVHSLWQPMAGRIKDYIAQPRYGVYQSLHTTVVGPDGKPLEVQIRTQDMHRAAEFGVTAHWRYKETKGHSSGDIAEVDDMAWMRQLLDWQRESADPAEFLEMLRFDLKSPEIFVFTAKGDVITLPQGSTPVDFAYAVHTEVGHRCIGARVNGRLVALERQLENGEVIEVFTSKAQNAGPNRDWQNFVKSPRAKAKIRQWFAKERREEALESGKDQIAKEVRRVGLPLQRLMSVDAMTAVAHELHYTNISELYAAVGEREEAAQHVVQRLMAQLGGIGDVENELADRSTPSTTPNRPRATGDAGVLVPGATGTSTNLAKCCTPVPGDEIMGFVTRGGAVSVHRTDCTNAGSLREQPERIIEVEWAPSPSSVFLVAIQIEALDRTRLLSDVTKVLADEKVNILSASATTHGDRVAISKFTFEMGDPKHLGHLLNVVRNVQGVYDVYRVTSST